MAEELRDKSILFLISTLKGGGAEKVADRLAKFLYQKKNVKVTFLTLRKNVDPMPYYNYFSLDIRKSRYAIRGLKRYLDSNHHLVILSFNRQLTILLILLRFLFRYRFKIVARNITMLSKSKQNQQSIWHRHISDNVVKLFYKFSDVVIAQSTYMAKDLIANYRIASKKVKVIHNPFERDIYFANRSYQGKRILFVGSLEKVKNVSFILKSFATALELNDLLFLNIVGTGSERTMLEDLASTLGINHRVKFVGYTDDVDGYYRDADLIVLASLFEGLPNVLIEANSFGVPAVALDTESGASEIIIHGKNGFLIKTDSTLEFGTLIVNALAYPWDSEEIRDTTERFDINKIGEEYLSLFEDVLSPLEHDGNK